MKSILSMGIVVAIFALVFSDRIISASAADLPRACEMDDPDLAETEPGVVKSIAIFSYRNFNYDAEIYGLAEPNPLYTERPYLICRRYEFRNTSGKTIKELRWPDIGVPPITETPAGKRYRFPKPVLSNSTIVRTAPTELWAWENIKAPSTTVFPVKTTIDKTISHDLGQNWIYSVDPAAFAKAIDDFPELGISIDATTSFYAPEKDFYYPTLQSGIVSDDINFLIFSSATVYLDKEYVENVVSIRASWERDGKPALFAPGIVTLANTKYTLLQTVEERIRNFAGDLSVFSSTDTNWLLGEKVIYRYPISADAGEPILFVTDQPVRLSIGDWSICVMASVYGPVPVTLSDDKYCRLAPGG